MSRAGRARRIAAAAAFGGGGIGALGAAAYGILLTEVKMARKWIGQPFGNAGPGGEGIYGPAADNGVSAALGLASALGSASASALGSASASALGSGSGALIQLAFLGDSTAVGLGADHPSQTPGVVLAQGLAAIAGRRVQLRVFGKVGAQSSALEDQTRRLLESAPLPDVVVIMVGANDVTHRKTLSEAVRALDAAVRRLREAGIEVVVGTCPDLGTIEQIPRPLRYLARRLSRTLAAAQTIAVVEAGGRSVSLGDLLGPEFAARPSEMFSSDKFHPSATGYAQVAAAMLPSVAAALGYWSPEQKQDGRPDVRRGEGIDDIAHAAVRAVDSAGTEVSGIEVSGAERGPRGRWAAIRRRLTPDAAPDGLTTPLMDQGKA